MNIFKIFEVVDNVKNPFMDRITIETKYMLRKSILFESACQLILYFIFKSKILNTLTILIPFSM